MYVCAEDGRELKIVRNGELVEELLDDGSPYKIFHADRWVCPACGRYTLVTANEAVSRPHNEEYTELSKKVNIRFHTFSGA